MNRLNLEHIIRAAGDIANVKEIYILGSQAILGEHPELDDRNFPEDSHAVNIAVNYSARCHLVMSREADILIPNHYELAETIEGAIGEDSQFHEQHGYYAQAIDESTCLLPDHWEERLVKICNPNTNLVAGYCLEKHDLFVSKLYANREKDIEYFRAACSLKLVNKDTLLKRLDTTSRLADNEKERIKTVIYRET